MTMKIMIIILALFVGRGVVNAVNDTLILNDPLLNDAGEKIVVSDSTVIVYVRNYRNAKKIKKYIYKIKNCKIKKDTVYNIHIAPPIITPEIIEW